MATFSHIDRSSPAFIQTTIALFAAGFSTFALLYCIQPLLPEIATAFRVSAAVSSLAISLTTGVLSATLLLAGSITERVPRKTMIVTSLAVTAIVTALGVLAPTWTSFLVLRAAAGVAFAGLPAIAMAYIGEEMSPRTTGLAMGIYVAGTAVGGMSGRLLAAALTDAFGWRAGVGTTGAIGIGAALLVAWLLPPSRYARPDVAGAGRLLAIYRAHLTNWQLTRLFVEGFLFMGAFVAIYNYLTFRLLEPPYSLGHTAIGSVFLLYLVGLISSPWAGTAAGGRGRRRTLSLSLTMMLVGVLLTLLPSLLAIVTGVGLVTFGFFAAQSVTSHWVGLSSSGHRAQASSLYIVFYYVGGSVAGTATGVFWARYGWPGVAGAVILLLVAALTLVVSIRDT